MPFLLLDLTSEVFLNSDQKQITVVHQSYPWRMMQNVFGIGPWEESKMSFSTRI